MLTIQLNSQTPIGEQIEQGIRLAIASGELSPGDSLPTVRQLASDLGVNLNTVARAYRSLEQSGLLTSVQGKGTQVRASTEAKRFPAPVFRKELRARCRLLFADSLLAGLNKETIRELVLTELEQFWPNDTMEGSK